MMTESIKQEHNGQIAFVRMEKFFENLQQFLDTLNCECEVSNEDQKEKRSYLLKECKSLMQNLKIHSPNDDNSYLDMSGVGMNNKSKIFNHNFSRIQFTIQQILILENGDEYMNLDQSESPPNKKLDQLDDLYDNCMISDNTKNQHRISSISLQPITSIIVEQVLTINICPYVGLPATHLKINKSPKQGILIRLEKRFFLDQNKKIYAGILDRWFLVYTGGLSDIKPAITIYIESFTYENHGSNFGQYLLTIWNENKKKFLFQAPNAQDGLEWCNCIRAITNTNISDDVNNVRQLPTPPNNFKQFEAAENSNKSEEIYEEPIIHSTLKENLINDSNSTYDCIDFNNSKSDFSDVKPQLPKKTKKKPNYNYDVPKPLNLQEQNEKTVCEKKINTPVNKKSWFLKRRINNKKTIVQSPNPMIVQTSKQPQTMSTSVGASVAASGSKVNMIINQLEANGKLNFLSKQNLNNKRYTVFSEQGLNNYEQINVKD